MVVVIPGPVGDGSRGGGDVRAGDDREAVGDGSRDTGAAGDASRGCGNGRASSECSGAAPCSCCCGAGEIWSGAAKGT